MQASEKKRTFGQLVKFVLVGGSNTLVDMIVHTVLNIVGVPIYLAKCIGYLCGIVNSYFLNSGWTFKKERKRDAREIILFLVVNAVTLGLSLGMIALFKNVLGWDAWWNALVGQGFLGKVVDGERFCSLCATVIALPINFVLNKLFVFRGGSTPPDAASASDEATDEKE